MQFMLARLAAFLGTALIVAGCTQAPEQGDAHAGEILVEIGEHVFALKEDEASAELGRKRVKTPVFGFEVTVERLEEELGIELPDSATEIGVYAELDGYSGSGLPSEGSWPYRALRNTVRMATHGIAQAELTSFERDFLNTKTEAGAAAVLRRYGRPDHDGLVDLDIVFPRRSMRQHPRSPRAASTVVAADKITALSHCSLPEFVPFPSCTVSWSAEELRLAFYLYVPTQLYRGRPDIGRLIEDFLLSRKQ